MVRKKKSRVVTEKAGVAPLQKRERKEAPLFWGSSVNFVFTTLTAVAEGKPSIAPDVDFTKRFLVHTLLSSERLCWGEFQQPGVAATALRIFRNPPLKDVLLAVTGINFRQVGRQIVEHWPATVADVFGHMVSGARQKEKLAQLVRGRTRRDAAGNLARFLGADIQDVEGKLSQARLELIDRVVPAFTLNAEAAAGILKVWRLPDQLDLPLEEKESRHALFIMKDGNNPLPRASR